MSPAARSALPTGTHRPIPAPTEQGLLEQVGGPLRGASPPPCLGVYSVVHLSMLLGLGPAGAVLYRTAQDLGRDWSAQPSAGGATGQ